MAKKPKNTFKKWTDELREALNEIGPFHDEIAEAVEMIRKAFEAGGRLFIAGNGGSAAESEHFAAEFVGRYKSNRSPYPAISLVSDIGVMTCIANDFGYEDVFARQVEALGKKGDIFFGITTSGTSENILAAATVAHRKGMRVIALTSPKGDFKDKADCAIIAPSLVTARIQELHLHAIHLICEMFEPE